MQEEALAHHMVTMWFLRGFHDPERHPTAAAFLARAQAPLERHEAANNLMISIAIRLKEYPDQIPASALPGDGGGRREAPGRSGDDPAAPGRSSTARAPIRPRSRLLAEDLRRFEWQPLGVIGPAEAAHAFATVWISMAGGTFRLLRHERVL